MRHRSPRPLLDRLLPDATPGMVRRSLLLVAAVVAAVALGVVVAGPLAEPGPGERNVAVDSPPASTSASWSVGPPMPDRDRRPSRSGKRSTPPAPPVEPAPSPAPNTPPPSPTASQTRTPSPTPEPTPTQTQAPQDSTSPTDRTAPQTSASTTSLEDGEWTVRASSNESGSFQCALDGGGYDACGPTATFDDLDNGKHTLAVRAVDEAGNVDPSPVQLVANITGNLDD